jgi:hypothetical protein
MDVMMSLSILAPLAPSLGWTPVVFSLIACHFVIRNRTVATNELHEPVIKTLNRIEINFYAPDHKMSGALCHGLCVGVRKHLVSVNYRTNACVD